MNVRITKLFPMVERTYNDKNTGERRSIKVKELIVTDGYHTMLVEATDEMAERVEKIGVSENTERLVSMRHIVRSWKKESGEEVFANKIQLVSIL